MQIELYETTEGIKIYWDTELQTQDPLAIIFVNNYETDLKSERREVETDNISNYRIIEKNYSFKDIYNIKKTIKYKNRIVSVRNGEVASVSSTLEEVPQIWHDETCAIQIVQNFKDNRSMVRVLGELTVYKRDAEIEDFEGYGNIYFYLNFLYDQHKILMEDGEQKRWITFFNCKEGFHLELHDGIWTSVINNE